MGRRWTKESREDVRDEGWTAWMRLCERRGHDTDVKVVVCDIEGRGTERPYDV